MSPGRLPGPWASKQQRQLAIGASVVSQIVIDNQDISSFFHKVFGNAGCRIWRDVDEAGRIVVFYDNHNCVFHRALLVEVGHYFSHRGCALANRTVDADHILPALVEDGVDCDGGLPGLTIAENQFALARPMGRVHRLLSSRSAKHADRRAIHDGRSRTFDREAFLRSYRALAVQRIAQWVDHASQQTFAHWNVHHTAGTLDLVACVQVLVVPEQDDTDLFFIQVECDAKQTARNITISS